MRAMKMLVLALAAAGGCDGTPDQTGEQGAASAPAAATESCEVLAPEDIQSVTGTAVTRVAYDPSQGLGGNCGNFADAEGEPFLGVSRLATRQDFTQTVESTPADMYPTRQPLPGLGDEAILLSGGEGRFRLRLLVARRGERGVVLFPLLDGMSMPDDQLQALAERALSRVE